MRRRDSRLIRSIAPLLLIRGLRSVARNGATFALLVIGCLLVASCEPGSKLGPLPDSPAYTYRLGVDDEVRIITLGQEQLTGQFRVNDRGNIAIPLLGAVKADGLTTSQLEDSIAQRLKDKEILTDPSVSVEILAYRPIFILGQVTKPGPYPYQPGMTVLTAVADAGGFTYRAQTDYASILRRINGQPVEGRVTRGADVVPGDVITIFDRYF